MITIENLRRKDFLAEEFIKSETAKKLKIKNIPNQAQLTAGMALADKMQELRSAIAKPINITSGFRCAQLNKAVGGAPQSWHMQFLACDFNVEGLEPRETVLAIKKTKISLDKVFVERGCVHIQTYMNSDQNRNIFATAFRNKSGNWEVKKGI